MESLRSFVPSVVVLLLAVVASLPNAAAQERGSLKSQIGSWPQFLGPTRNGISSEKNLLANWPQEGPDEVWRVRGGVGMSGLAIHQGRLLTMIQTGGKQRVLALNAKSGKRLWETPVAPEYENQMGNGPRATPTIAADRVFVFTGEGVLAAVRFSDGELLWRQKVLEQLRVKPADYGMACSPLVVGNRIIVTPGAPGAAVAAFEAATGELVWKSGSAPAGYSSPVLLRVSGRDQVVALMGDAALGLDPKTGKRLWRHDYVTDYRCNTATPIAVEGKVLLSSGENHGSVLLSLTPGDERFRVKEVWASQGAAACCEVNGKRPFCLGAICTAPIMSAAPGRSRTWCASTRRREKGCGGKPGLASAT